MFIQHPEDLRISSCTPLASYILAAARDAYLTRTLGDRHTLFQDNDQIVGPPTVDGRLVGHDVIYLKLKLHRRSSSRMERPGPG